MIDNRHARGAAAERELEPINGAPPLQARARAFEDAAGPFGEESAARTSLAAAGELRISTSIHRVLLLLLLLDRHRGIIPPPPEVSACGKGGLMRARSSSRAAALFSPLVPLDLFVMQAINQPEHWGAWFFCVFGLWSAGVEVFWVQGGESGRV